MIPLLLDIGMPQATAAELRSRGWDVVHGLDVGLGTVEDTAFVALSLRESRVIVTLDADFISIVAAGGLPLPSIVHVRIQGLKRNDVTELLFRVLPTIADDLRSGCIASVNRNGVRVRKLPIARTG